MKKSGQVPAALVIALASVSLNGCSSDGGRECVDAAGRIRPGRDCTSGVGGAHWIGRGVSTGGYGGTSGGYYGG
jgi:hypothetical protein